MFGLGLVSDAFWVLRVLNQGPFEAGLGNLWKISISSYSSSETSWIYLISLGSSELTTIYIWKGIMTTKGAFEQSIGLISPSKRTAISSFRGGYIIVTPWAITHIMGKFIRSSFLEACRMPIILCFCKTHPLILGRIESVKSMNTIFTKETTIVFPNIGISASSIRAIVSNFSLWWNSTIGLHNKINTVF